MVGIGVVTEAEDAVATNGIAEVVEVTEEVVVDSPEDIALIRPETDIALLAVDVPGPGPGPVVSVSGASLITS